MKPEVGKVYITVNNVEKIPVVIVIVGVKEVNRDFVVDWKYAGQNKSQGRSWGVDQETFNLEWREASPVEQELYGG